MTNATQTTKYAFTLKMNLKDIKLLLARHFSQHYSSQTFNSADYELFRVISLSLNHVCILKQTSYRLVHISDSVSKFV